jgi:hypothetical protein
MTLKINRQGVVTDSAAAAPETAVLEEQLEQAETEIAELEAKRPVPVVETDPAPAVNPQPAAPRVPPRRTPPPGAAGG